MCRLVSQMVMAKAVRSVNWVIRRRVLQFWFLIDVRLSTSKANESSITYSGSEFHVLDVTQGHDGGSRGPKRSNAWSMPHPQSTLFALFASALCSSITTISLSSSFSSRSHHSSALRHPLGPDLFSFLPFSPVPSQSHLQQDHKYLRCHQRCPRSDQSHHLHGK